MTKTDVRLTLHKITFLDNGPYSLDLRRGECCGLNGASGAGKSQFLRAIADVAVHGGECFLEGVSSRMFTPQQWRMSVALVPAESFWWYDTVGPHFTAVSSAEPFVSNLFSRLGFESDVMNWQISRLSTGERQRLSLIRTLLTKPKVLLLDEPTSGLDQNMIAAVEAIVTEICTGSECSCLWVSHDIGQLGRVAERSYTLQRTGLEELRT